MNKSEYTNFVKRYSMLNSVEETPTIEKMIELQNAVFTTTQKGNMEKLWEERIALKVKRQKELARLASNREYK
jgi:head-tail adaptor